MQNNNLKLFENIESKTKIYLAIIAIIMIILCIYKPVYIIPMIGLYILVIIYTMWISNKRQGEISTYIEELTISVDSAAKNTLINSPFPIIILETDGNVIWRSAKFNKEFANVGINTYIEELAKEIKLEIENNNKPNINRDLNIGDRTYHVIGDYVKIRQKDRRKQHKYMTILYFVDITKYQEILQKYNDSQTCIGIIMIDNYEEIIQRIAAEERPQVTATIEKMLYDWAATTGGIVIKTERDTFVYVFEQKYLEEMKEEKFSILDKIKDVKTADKLQLTLSIAVSNEGESNYEKYDASLVAMDIALRKRRRSSCN